MKQQANYCTVARAFDIADETMFDLFMAHSEVDEETGLRVRTDDASNEAAKWLIGRGMAKAHNGLIEIVELPDAWADV